MIKDFVKGLSILKKIYLFGIILVVPLILIEIVSTDSLKEPSGLTWFIGILVALLLLMMADFVYALEKSSGQSTKSALVRTIVTMVVGMLCGGLSLLFI